MDEETYYDDYRDSLIEEGSRIDRAWLDSAQEELDNAVDARMRKPPASVSPAENEKIA